MFCFFLSHSHFFPSLSQTQRHALEKDIKSTGQAILSSNTKTQNINYLEFLTLKLHMHFLFQIKQVFSI